MAEVGGKLIGIFARNLADMLTADNAAGSPAAAGAEQADPAGVAEAAAAQADAARAAAAQADAAGAAAGAAADLALPVEELHLALRSHNSLRRDGIHTVGELAARTEQQLLAIDHIGPASVEEIRQKLAERGLSLSTPGGSAASTGSAGSAPAGRANVRSAASQGGTPASAAGAAAGNGAVPSRAAANGDARPAGSSPRQDRADSKPPGEEAIDLLSVAGLPVLKRVIPVLAGLAVVIAVVFGFRLRQRRADR
jgi:hypothetical protein